MKGPPKIRLPKPEATAVNTPHEPSWSVKVQIFPQPITSVPEYELLTRALLRSRSIAAPIRRTIIQNTLSSYNSLAKAGSNTINHTAVLLNAIMASDISHSMEVWTKHLVERAPTVYDKAMDAAYNATQVGGGQLHRLFDGSHTVWGAWQAVHNAKPDDSFMQETAGYFSALWHDLGTHVGLPLMTWDKATYDQVANALHDTFHIPKPWFQALLHVNVVDLLADSIGAVAIVHQWKRKDVKQFSRLCGSLEVSAVISANPVLGVLALAGAAKSFMDARQSGDYTQFVNGLTKGGVGTCLILGTSAIVGGPAWVGLLAGVCAGVAAHKAMSTIEPSEISQFLISFVKERVPMYLGEQVG